MTSRDVYFFGNACAFRVGKQYSFGAYVCHRRPGGSMATSHLVRCHAGSCKGAEQISIDVGLWVAVFFLAKISFHRPTCKTTFARLTQSQAISQSFRVFITFRSMRDTTFFHFSKLMLFVQNTASFTMVIKRCPGGAGGGRSTSKSTCEVPA